MSKETIESRLKVAFPDATIEVFSQDDVHFQVVVVDASFVNQSVLAQHRAVYQALGERWSDDIHAIGLTTRAP